MPKDRAYQILKIRSQGFALESIGGMFKLTRERIRQIIARHQDSYPELKKSIEETRQFLASKGRKQF